MSSVAARSFALIVVRGEGLCSLGLVVARSLRVPVGLELRWVRCRFAFGCDREDRPLLRTIGK